jgi:hypothetical protein
MFQNVVVIHFGYLSLQSTMYFKEVAHYNYSLKSFGASKDFSNNCVPVSEVQPLTILF